MSHRAVAASALQPLGFTVSYVAIDGFCDVFMPTAASVFGDLVIELGDLDVVGIAAAGEVERMPESIIGLHHVLAHDVMGCMTVIAGGRVPMPGLDPTVILSPHDMAIDA